MSGPKMSINGKMSRTIIEFFRFNIPIFARLNDEELGALEKYMKIVRAESGEILFEEGDEGGYLCFLMDGLLEVSKVSESGERVVLTKLSQGNSIGEMSVIDDLPRSATVKALKQSTLITLSKESVNKILEDYPVIGVKILKGVSRALSVKLRETSDTLVSHMLPFV